MSMRVLSVDVPAKRQGGWVFQDEDQLLHGPIIFDPEGAEAEDYRVLAKLLDDHKPHVVILEHGFLFAILPYLGAVKGFCAERGIAWWQVGASRAKKLVLGRGHARKEEVQAWAQKLLPDVDQHVSDALLYLHAWLVQRGGDPPTG